MILQIIVVIPVVLVVVAFAPLVSLRVVLVVPLCVALPVVGLLSPLLLSLS